MFDVIALVEAAGYLGLFAIVFVESGLFFGFFFPGDSLLFTAGVLASHGLLSFPAVVAVTFTAAILGVSVGYAFGKKVGPAIFKKHDSFFFHKDHLERTRVFYQAHGPKTIVLARFLPIIRTFAPIFAGIGRMHYRTFFFYNIVGGALWTVGLTGAGYYLGSVIPDIDRYLIPIILGIIIVSLIPALREFAKSRK
ncbi:hypothetical protein A3C91_04990 [Candidatus Azambacteria bacterium RIFCSPHIGHO2_02_FULL_52_12]|uniref:VTT domain-containing protein n=1 Tax=Candidatus Azambacteria bacterium RIFCSPLOWO2_01_FULL_46_25 TaxID=1797298 RepID=A0A1F5BVW1_9BACT|nr:MAG: hypothetical protein A3C91_04990 [Candidatus Azambacteria bacterium RIFCSPHIGHO2_02_FULL_52_12]OGD34745.1 MAG: hypothetical protein A2988_04600 [Candidatus Azambacteria bacterium RIFCSPLOWO2_01_FULL_46_25]OGD36947.1 MAG: hypothetical protein A2850_00845 [Candidatus Azambacteria bacterium RIFCSPHIGHO2_01_FULL_51_74]